jgi:hypothetical protein
MTSCPYGFRIVGATSGRRRLVDATAAFLAYASCDPRAEIDREAYLSAFTFGGEFRAHIEATGSTKDYSGPCGAAYLWWDIDNPEEPERALSDARALAGALLERYRALDDNDLLLFFSGSKGYHIGLPTSLWGPGPSLDFNAIARRFAEGIARLAGATVDGGVYDKVRAFRAPNSWHPKGKLYKRRLNHDELMHLTADRIRALAEKPEPFEVPAPAAASEVAAKDWAGAAAQVRQEAEAKRQRRSTTADGTARLNKLTLDFIRDGADQGDRHRLLFSAAANLAEFGCPPALAHALLTERALDSGLTPSDVRRQIECGLAHVKGGTKNA